MGLRLGPHASVGNKMQWWAPHALPVMFNPEHGFFVWTPLALVAIAGLVRNNRVMLCLLLMVALQVYVPDSDATYALAVERGATALRPIAENYGSRGGVIRDPFGHRWFVQTNLEADDVPVEDAPGRRLGDIGYMTLNVPDAARARAFYGALFGWDARESGEGFHISSITPPAGISGGHGVGSFMPKLTRTAGAGFTR